MIVCCGEALVDFFPVTCGQGKQAFQPFAGGSIFNVAIGLGRLGSRVGYFGGISRDFFGDMLLDALVASSVDTSLVAISDRPSTLAFVSFENSQPRYAFFDQGSAGRMLESGNGPVFSGEVRALHFGSFSLINDPAASLYEELAAGNAGQRLISLDPNIRPTLVGKKTPYLERLERMLAIADIIKVSDEDLEWLFPGADEDLLANDWLKGGARLVIITRGSRGAVAYIKDFRFVQPAISTIFKDSVGAGDSFGAAILASLDGQGLLEKSRLAEILPAQLETAMAMAARAAAITVSRAGANPPWQHEL